MRITGELPSVVADGFAVLTESGTVAAGTLDLADIDDIAALNNAVHIEAGKDNVLRLDARKSVIKSYQVGASTSVVGHFIRAGSFD